MRTFLIFLVAVLCSAVLPAQARQVTLELEGGAVVEGRVVAIDTKAIVVDVDGQERTYSTEQIRKCTFKEIDGQTARTTAPAATATPTPAPKQDPAPPANDARAQQPDGAAAGNGAQQPAAAATQKPIYRSLWDKRLEALDRRYPWLFPAERMQWISLSVMLFALLSLAVHFAARLAAAENRGFSRATGIGMWMLLTGIGQLAVLPPSSAALGAAIAGNTLVVLVLFGVVYGLSIGGALLGTIILAVEGGLGFALLQLVDATLRSIGNTTF